MEVHTIHHVGLEVGDLAEASRFYGDVLGLPVRSDRPRGAPPGLWFDAGDRRLSLVPTGTIPDAAHVALVVDDVEGAVASLRAQGIDAREMTPPFLNAMFQDPWGNWIELRRPPSVWAAHFGSAPVGRPA